MVKQGPKIVGINKDTEQIFPIPLEYFWKQIFFSTAGKVKQFTFEEAQMSLGEKIDLLDVLDIMDE